MREVIDLAQVGKDPTFCVFRMQKRLLIDLNGLFKIGVEEVK